ncbi:hypothetical protein OE88DRAFT_1617130, partial [Heliocybe sulcata]
AIFRLRGSFSSQNTSSAAHSAFSSGTNTPTDVTAILGLAIEPLPTIAAQIAQLPSAVQKPGDPTVLAEKVVKHLFNYVSGFVGGSGVTPDSAVPMGMIARWYESFVGKVRAGGVGFLE